MTTSLCPPRTGARGARGERPIDGRIEAHEERLADQERTLGDAETKVKVGIAVLVGGLLASRPELVEKLIQVLAD